ncbi:MAG: 6-phosphofructokinase [Gemmatimonadota bacterium]|jgi:6-phosphofructokinase 1|nr:6-phosphofructokinase [Gemmatimonadota bacterium]MDP6528757.1 6-phosphofructokinase [Gemmatimonadota bacterium]MDP6803186.1 6-phosphofructokinase [Gemmatimonadota bacterium]MDP7031276.1 6-phosphofructokinase [Gemmatimonadota bacterium]
MTKQHPRIGVLTGGGDVPGLNAVIKSVVYRGSEMGREVVGFRRGWMGLTHMDPSKPEDPEFYRPLTRENTRRIDRSGGTILHTSRTNPKNVSEKIVPEHMTAESLARLGSYDGVYDFTPVVMENLDRLGVGCLVAIGGDDTLSFAAHLHHAGMPVIAIPKTMDNDVRGTEYCIGFSTAITRAKELITRQRTTLGSHERIGIFRIFGRDAGFTALYTGYVTSTRCLIPEHRFDLEEVVDLLASDKAGNPSNYALIVMSEGASWSGHKVGEYGVADAYGHRRKVDIGLLFGEEITRRTGVRTLHSDLTYDLRSGAPDAIDQIVATTFANIAMDLVADGVSGRMIAVQGGRYAHTDIPDPALGPRVVDVDTLYNAERCRPQYNEKLGDPLWLSHA